MITKTGEQIPEPEIAPHILKESSGQPLSKRKKTPEGQLAFKKETKGITGHGRYCDT